MRTVLVVLILLMSDPVLALLPIYPACPRQPVKIMPLGDSLTEGGYNLNGKWFVGPGYRLKLKSLLYQQNIAVDFVGSRVSGAELFDDPQNEGYSGFTIDQLLPFVEPAVSIYKPDIILLMIGSNDVIRNISINEAPLRFKNIVLRILARAPHAQVFASSIITTNNFLINGRLHRYNQGLKKVFIELSSQNAKLHWVDMYAESGLEISPLDFTDGVHPTPRGFEKMAKVWNRALLTHLKCR